MNALKELFGDARFILNYRQRVMQDIKRINAQAPQAGDMAPDFTLTDSSGTETVTLSDFRGEKPVALVFGSYT
jgi:peroxiredoxin